jgi:transcriptional regulator with XRE-family HTH domain
MDWFSLGKQRSRFGRWLDKKGLSQTEFGKMSGVSKSTISDLASDDNHSSSGITMRKILNAARKIDPKVNHTDFWDM